MVEAWWYLMSLGQSNSNLIIQTRFAPWTWWRRVITASRTGFIMYAFKFGSRYLILTLNVLTSRYLALAVHWCWCWCSMWTRTSWLSWSNHRSRKHITTFLIQLLTTGEQSCSFYYLTMRTVNDVVLAPCSSLHSTR